MEFIQTGRKKTKKKTIRSKWTLRNDETFNDLWRETGSLQQQYRKNCKTIPRVIKMEEEQIYASENVKTSTS